MIEDELKAALIDLQEGIEARDGDRVKDRIRFIDQTFVSHRRELDARLKHFLKNRSYQKALAYMQGSTDIPPGRCSGRTDFS